MRPFTYHNPTRIIFGRGARRRIGEETAPYGRRILLVHGRNFLEKSGRLTEITASLMEAGVEVFVCGGVKPNPVLSQVRKAIQLAREWRVEAIVAAGGGSVIDSAKAIAAGVVAGHDVWQFFKGKKGIRAALPLICLPTLAGSGSEMNCGMVLTNGEKSQKFGIGNKALYPKVSILDPEVTFSVAPDQSAYGAVDAMAHALEYYFTTTDPDTPLQDRLTEGLAATIMESCGLILKEPANYQARAAMMWASALALNGLTSSGLGWVGFPMHMIEHSLSALYDVPHGAGLAVIMPAWLHFHAERDPHKLALFGRRIFKVKAADAADAGAQTIAALKCWLQSVSCPMTLAELGIPANEIPVIAGNAMGLAKLWRLREYTPEILAAILRSCAG